MKLHRLWAVVLAALLLVCVLAAVGCKDGGGQPPDGMEKNPANAKKFMMEATGGKGLGPGDAKGDGE